MDVEVAPQAKSRHIKSKRELKKTKPASSKASSSKGRKGKQIANPSDDDESDDFDDDVSYNGIRRAQRRTQYNPTGELLAIQDAGHREASRIAKVLARETTKRVRAEQDRRVAITRNDLSGLVYLQNVARVWCHTHDESTIDARSPSWDRLPLNLFTSIAHSSTTLTFDPKPFVQCGDLELCNGLGEVDRDSYAFYIRVVEVAGKVQAVQALYNILAEYPRELPHIFVQLLVCGEPVDQIRERAKVLLVPFGLEEVVDVVCDALAEEPATLAFAESPSPPTSFLYAGITRAVLPSQRVADDLAGEVPCRMTKLHFANPDLVPKTYRIPALTTAISSEFAIRIDPIISELERIAIALAGEPSLNSASGGERPLYCPKPDLLALRDVILERAPHPNLPLGDEKNACLGDQLERLYDDELRLFSRISPSETPAKEYVTYAKHIGLGSIRRNHHRVVAITITKDISLEALNGRTGGYFDEVSGAGPREHRHFQRFIDPTLPLNGNLDEMDIARSIGGFLDFWRFCRNHRYWWLHVLFLARLLDRLRPLIIVTQSNPVAKMLQSGHLAERRERMVASEHYNEFFVQGRTTDKFVETLRRQKPIKFQKDQYLAIIGEILLLPIGVDSRLAMHIAGGDYGLLKYQPQHYQAWSEILFLVAVIVEVLKRVTADRQDRFPMTLQDWEDEERTQHWLQETIAAARTILEPVYERLDTAKDVCRELTFADSFLSSLATSRRSHLFWEQEASAKPDSGPRPRPPGIVAAADGEPRRLQGQAFVEQAERLASYNLWHDPHHVESYNRHIGSDGWWEWLMGIQTGVQLVYSANAGGKTAEAWENAQRSRRDLALYRVQVKEDDEEKRLRHLENAIDGAADMQSYDLDRFDSWEVSPRFGFCDKCRKVLAADNNQITHDCADGAVKLDLKSCSTLERFLYPHDGEDLFEILGFRSTVLRKLELKTVTVAQIFAMEGQFGGSEGRASHRSRLAFCSARI
ncbi:hypothetical protein C8F01DRAFT_11165 [Mycena amicta]|nr:hypothetical protein C8F01DRAFT_11165 [Mycena amicta]